MVNVLNMNKQEKEEFLQGHCIHRMPYRQHPRCYERETNKKIKVGYFDIESGGLNANFDIILCYSIKTRGSDEIKRCQITKQDVMDETLDKSVCKQLIKDLQEYDIIMTFYGTKFDIPFVRSRCLSYGLKFPVFGTVKHKDIFYMVRNKMKMHSSSLESACALLGIEGKNHIKGNIWIRAKYGNDKYLKYVQDHCDRDVIITEKLHKRLEDFVRTNSKSI